MIDASLTDPLSVLLAPFSASPSTSGYSLVPPQTSDGLFINPHGGQSRPDENGVQTSWEDYQACIHLVLWREGEWIPKWISRFMCGIVFIIKCTEILLLWVFFSVMFVCQEHWHLSSYIILHCVGVACRICLFYPKLLLCTKIYHAV